MTTPKRTTFSINLDKKLKLEKMAIEASQKTGRIVNWTEIMNVLVDDYAKDAQATIIHRSNQEKK